MDNERLSPSPPPGPSPPAYASHHPSELERHGPHTAVAGPQPLPSLPSIHQLPLNLPSSSTGLHRLSMAPPHPYAPTYESASGYSAGEHSRASPLHSAPFMPLRVSALPMRYLDDSEHDGGDPGPPKKKRRRQALSCTGKRRLKMPLVDR
ncbi:uncharacterized protein PHACADRAFT_28299 [Phanerochaete carnosa HHB-10118-sp]|uniref:Uncharacterized protein n=1 Tax=Phanerochaete carnosa (strain HHB-10118-sp) TaxID=650164 RepID=K5UYL9_PHACS|nr:uncharacterized protein PHACADRAFT_28299 [Phanerochaete carnosa HHB-10118-sp]EKM55246.1 hypothetical protein PHACADRAFT_28299 [Phanerochaete carnosa HHB-10118-sp]